MKVRFWGVRGSIPSPGPATVRMGGNTPCVEVVADNETLIFDSGSGIRALGNKLMREGKPVRACLFMTHCHHDHVQGWPFFVPAFVPTTRLRVFSERKGEMGPKDIFSGIMVPPYFPIPLVAMKAQFEWNEVKDGDAVNVTPHLTVTARKLNHPNGALGYRIESTEKGRTRAIAYITDTEHGPEPDQNVIELARNTEAMIYDCCYTPPEYESRKGWGHSTWVEGVKIAKLAKAKRLMIFHHDQGHTDKDMDKILGEARKEHKATFLAYEGLELSF